jgi:hypothetical protein
MYFNRLFARILFFLVIATKVGLHGGGKIGFKDLAKEVMINCLKMNLLTLFTQ